VSDERLNITPGIAPVSLLKDNVMDVNLCKLPRFAGMEPLSSLFDNIRVSSSVRLPKEGGIPPDRRFASSVKKFRF
jgi:hypothetical protein